MNLIGPACQDETHTDAWIVTERGRLEPARQALVDMLNRAAFPVKKPTGWTNPESILACQTCGRFWASSGDYTVLIPDGVADEALIEKANARQAAKLILDYVQRVRSLSKLLTGGKADRDLEVALRDVRERVIDLHVWGPI